MKLFLIILLIFIISPFFTVILLRIMFKKGVASTRPGYEDRLASVSVSSSAECDIFTPKGEIKKTVFWIHGGAFVAGSKKDIHEYAVELAYEGYKVLCLSYPLAPKGRFPTLLNYFDEKFRELEDEIVNDFVLAGDSAGAHIALQYQIAKSSHEYFKALNIPSFKFEKKISQLLLFCGPYNKGRLFNQLQKAPFIFKKIAWDIKLVYVSRNSDSDLLNLIDYLPENMPEIFITDGNHYSFLKDNLELVSKMEALNIKHTAIFPKEDTVHEYQFMMANEPAQETFQALIEFLY